MSNLSVDLKVIETHAPSVARAAGVSEDRVIAGLVRLWHRCWSTSRETLQRSEVAGAFGPDRLAELIEALEVDFLEKQGDGSFRVRGADQYLRIKAGRRKGAEKTNAALAERRSSVAQASLGNALSPVTEHRSPNTEHREAAAAGEVVDGHSFWRTAQERRVTAGLVRERPPHDRALSSWFSVALLEEGVTVEKLLLGYELFLVDSFWRNEADRPCSWGGWVRQWQDFVTKATAPGVIKPLNTKAPAPVSDWKPEDAGEVRL